MVKLLIGRKGSGKTKHMIDMANASLEQVNGSVVFINKTSRLTYDLKYRIRNVCMEDFAAITNTDEYIGFLYGILSQDHDIELVFIDSIMQHSDVKVSDLEGFLARLEEISTKFGPKFVVSLSIDKSELGDYINKYEIEDIKA